MVGSGSGCGDRLGCSYDAVCGDCCDCVGEWTGISGSFRVWSLSAACDWSTSRWTDLATIDSFGEGCAEYGLRSTVYYRVDDKVCRMPDVSDWCRPGLSLFRVWLCLLGFRVGG